MPGVVVDSSNHWYGHAHVLATYCGLDGARPPRVNGIIQHGWTFVHGFGVAHRPPWGFPKYVWSDACRRRGQAVGWRDFYVIGAPFLYLQETEKPDPLAPAREGTIWYPFHGTADFERLSGSHEDLIATILEVEEGPVTVCLYYVEFNDPTIRSAYEEAGFRVICHGYRGSLWTGGTPDFLSRQLGELRRHRRVASNRLTTAIFYGIAAGCEPAVYGDPMELVDVAAGFNGEGLLEANFAQLHGPHLDLEEARHIGAQELGLEWMLTPEEMRWVFGWADEPRSSA